MADQPRAGESAAAGSGTDVRGPWMRSMLGRFATGVTVVAARHGPLLAGMTANAIASISLDPPLLMASVNRKSETHVAIVGSHSFAVSVLAADQEAIATCFALPTTADKLQRFCDVPWHEAETGSPIVDGSIAYFDCRVSESHPAGTHTIFIGEIVEAGYEEDGEPLLWFGSRYRRIAPEAT